jgi:CHAT domain-containing protein
VGLSQAFLAAGAERVLATLWLVDDRVTAELMTGFHAVLAEGKGEATALAEVQRDALGAPRTADPYYWAGLTLMGGW